MSVRFCTSKVNANLTNGQIGIWHKLCPFQNGAKLRNTLQSKDTAASFLCQSASRAPLSIKYTAGARVLSVSRVCVHPLALAAVRCSRVCATLACVRLAITQPQWRRRQRQPNAGAGAAKLFLPRARSRVRSKPTLAKWMRAPRPPSQFHRDALPDNNYALHTHQTPIRVRDLFHPPVFRCPACKSPAACVHN